MNEVISLRLDWTAIQQDGHDHGVGMTMGRGGELRRRMKHANRLLDIFFNECRLKRG